MKHVALTSLTRDHMRDFGVRASKCGQLATAVVDQPIYPSVDKMELIVREIDSELYHLNVLLRKLKDGCEAKRRSQYNAKP